MTHSFPVYKLTPRRWRHWTFAEHESVGFLGWIETERADVRMGVHTSLFLGDSRLKADAAVRLAKRGDEGLRWEGVDG